MPAYKANYLNVSAEQAGRRLDNFLLSLIKGVPRSHMHKLIRSGQVRVNSRRAGSDYRLVAGDRVRVPPLRAAEKSERVPSADLCSATEKAIFYRSDKLIALNKPANQSVHAGTREHCGIIEAINYLYPSQAEEGNWHLVYRLDKDATGCLLVVKGSELKRQLQAHWHDADCHKIYHLVVHGVWPWRLCYLTGTIGKTRVGGERIMRPLSEDAGGKQAHTHFRLLSANKNFSLLEAKLGTGRTHQIRSQCAFAGYPIVGDSKYAFVAGRHFNRQEAFLALHCYKIILPLELNLPKHEFVSPAPKLEIENITENE